MKSLILSFLFVFGSIFSMAQTVIHGTVTDGKKPLSGASIIIKNSFDGATSNDLGQYTFTTTEKGALILEASTIGYKTFSTTVTTDKNDILLDIVLKEKANELNTVTITAGSFDASDKRKTVVLSSLDIVTTAGANGDVTGALKTLPGTQQIGNQEGLFVRGGEGRETQTYVDGMLVRNTFNTSVPDIAQRVKFSPFLFKGTSFSSGGYSALYGQGLSAALILETKDLAQQTESNVALSSVGVGVGHNHLFKNQKSSAGFSLGYNNLTPYFLLVKQNIDFTTAPDNLNFDLNYRKKIKGGFLKFYGYTNQTHMGLLRPDINDLQHLQSLFESKSNYYYSLITLDKLLNDQWKMQLGFSYSNNNDDIKIGSVYMKNNTLYKFKINSKDDLLQGRALFTRYLGALSNLKFGIEHQLGNEKSIFNGITFVANSTNSYQDNFTALFAESDIYFGNKFVLKPGLRYDYSSILNQGSLQPRLSAAYKINIYSQISLAGGRFSQKPDRRFILLAPTYHAKLSFEEAWHSMLQYQYIANDRIFRAEIFYKKFEKLLSTPISGNAINTLGNYSQLLYDTMTVNGNGYAQGFELFLRDKKTIKNCDYWISYSYLDTKRKFSYYPVSVQPDFAATHTANFVFKQFFPKIMLGYGFTYSIASGRPYYNPNNGVADFMKDKTPFYNTLGVNVNYLTKFAKAFTVLVLGISNATGNKLVYGYRYANNLQNREAIGPTARTFAFVGCFMNWGVDRRNQNVDDNLK